ncbi:hypothetical protein A9G41_12450 [Gilliamella sp. Nev5-1]|uniref:hypothetical protein n=1 Tax=Gilliamella sp. Nev5-1 TaxID=3120251 RepID=UPI000827F8FD|nr:hypothetical protein [Gilliamella apicola]OCG66618.1 hypothetical protein A9G41_12450 [Gilliamella apicola]
MAKCVYEIRKIIPNGYNVDENGIKTTAYEQTLELNSFSDVKKFLSTKNHFTVGWGSDVFRNGELVFNVEAFEDCKMDNKLTLKSIIECYNDNK